MNVLFDPERASTSKGHLETTEVRWFLPGPLPPEVRSWFSGNTGILERRRDTYLVASPHDRSVKLRGGETLELKVRRQVGPSIELGDGLAGPQEQWRKWTPADSLVEASPRQRWVDVHKTIIKRRFSPEGEEQTFSPGRYEAPACDVEVADVRVGDVAAWTLAFAAFGPPAGRRDALVACWEGLKASASGPAPMGLDAGRANSYPEWIAEVTAGLSGTDLRERVGDGDGL